MYKIQNLYRVHSKRSRGGIQATHWSFDDDKLVALKFCLYLVISRRTRQREEKEGNQPPLQEVRRSKTEGEKKKTFQFDYVNKLQNTHANRTE